MFVRELKFPRGICRKNQNERSSAGPSCSFPAYTGSDKIPPQFPVPLTSAGLPEELLLSPHACCTECLPSPPCTPSYHPPIHPPIVHQSTIGSLAVCMCVCVERVRKKKEKKKGVELQHSVLFISTVSHGTLGKWNVCSSGWLQHRLRFDWSWMLRTEHITELGGRPSRKKMVFFFMSNLPFSLMQEPIFTRGNFWKRRVGFEPCPV